MTGNFTVHNLLLVFYLNLDNNVEKEDLSSRYLEAHVREMVLIQVSQISYESEVLRQNGGIFTIKL